MTKKIALLLAMILTTVGIIAGCSGRIVNDGSLVEDKQDETPTTEDLKAETTEGLKAGLAIIPSASSSKDAGDEDGLAQVDVSVASVTVDGSGRVVTCAIDAVQVNVNFDQAGKITTDLTAEIKTKNELGEAYGMKKASSIQKEWNEQAAAFAAYCVGKTADEISSIAAGADGKPADVDLAAGCTMHPGNFQWVVVKAIENAE